jgi:hypothetical protein
MAAKNRRSAGNNRLGDDGTVTSLGNPYHRVRIGPRGRPSDGRQHPMIKLTDWDCTMLEKLVVDELARARKSGAQSTYLNSLAALEETLSVADSISVETFRATTAQRTKP